MSCVGTLRIESYNKIMKHLRCKKHIYALLFIIMISGCSKTPTDEDRLLIENAKKQEAEKARLEFEKTKLGTDVMSPLDIYKILATNNINLTIGRYFDTFYLPVTKDFVFHNVAGATFNFFDVTGLPYRQGINDCDDYTLAGVVLARRAYYEIYRDFRPVSILFGEFHYIRRDGVNHAINCFITPQRTLLFFEPQSNSLVSLTKEEIMSCTFWRF